MKSIWSKKKKKKINNEKEGLFQVEKVIWTRLNLEMFKFKTIMLPCTVQTHCSLTYDKIAS